MKTRQMVYIVLGETSDQTSLEYLRKRVFEVFGKKISDKMACQYRLQWRKDVSIERDARTHADIPGRNMLNSKLVTAEHIKCIFSFLTKAKINPDDILSLIDSKDAKFHSLGQLVRAIKDLKDLQVEFKRA